MRRFLFCGVLVLVLTGCGVDPRDQADADRTRLLAEQEAANLAADRTQAEELAGLQLAEQEGTQAERVAGRSVFIRWFSIFGTVAACGAVLAAAVGFGWGAIGTGQAVARGAAVRAGLIPLDEKTRQFPVLVSYVGHGRFTLANPNTGELIALDTRRNGDRDLIRASGAVQLAGAIAREAARSNDPAGVALVRPVILEGVEHETV